MKGKIREDYYNWIVNLTCDWCSKHGEYSELMSYLYSQQFYYRIKNDDNRASDGIELRFRFAEESDYTYRDVYLYLMQPCTVLEMMAALAIRCEDHIMGDQSGENHTDIWFWTMIKTMHLDHMVNGNLDEDEAEFLVTRMLNREFRKDGDGGLFRITDKSKDMRNVEIWCQLNWFLKEYIDGSKSGFKAAYQ